MWSRFCTVRNMMYRYGVWFKCWLTVTISALVVWCYSTGAGIYTAGLVSAVLSQLLHTLLLCRRTPHYYQLTTIQHVHVQLVLWTTLQAVTVCERSVCDLMYVAQSLFFGYAIWLQVIARFVHTPENVHTLVCLWPGNMLCIICLKNYFHTLYRFNHMAFQCFHFFLVFYTDHWDKKITVCKTPATSPADNL